MGGVLLLVAVLLAVVAGAVMTVDEGAAPESRGDRSGAEDDRAVTVLVVASLAVAAGTTGAALLSPSWLWLSGLAPFLVPVVAVLPPLLVGAHTARRRARRQRRTRT
ncbi:hypothetical protein SAMN06272737_117102 [Blastococcus mobilis]|uniref:Uncharacterized protein n=1 Tax=Blastococcus mobilis TaxID=1938746 RepID=A0A238Y5C2_9ACTN|nr:hypothetical protein SAMN06272737_117102 [Blastococcus mobilis]